MKRLALVVSIRRVRWQFVVDVAVTRFISMDSDNDIVQLCAGSKLSAFGGNLQRRDVCVRAVVNASVIPGVTEGRFFQ